MSDQIALKTAYENVKALSAENYQGSAIRCAISSLCELSLDILINRSSRIQLISRVSDKNYISYQASGAVARPANTSLFIESTNLFKSLWQQWNNNSITPSDAQKLLYTTALAPCLAMELYDKQNKKGPATYFECYIGHLFATKVGAEPTKRASLEIDGSRVRLTMDFLFDAQSKLTGYHVPVKMSTRERVVQAWAHQRLLNSAFGANRYKGVMVLFSETKLDSRNLEVVEICVPDQWLAYQKHLAHMQEIYYFDMPKRYLEMSQQHPDIFNLSPISNLII